MACTEQAAGVWRKERKWGWALETARPELRLWYFHWTLTQLWARCLSSLVPRLQNGKATLFHRVLWLLQHLWCIKAPAMNKALDDKCHFPCAHSQVFILTWELVWKVHNPISSKTKYKSKTAHIKSIWKMQNSKLYRKKWHFTTFIIAFETQYPKVQIISNDLTVTKSTYTKFLNSASVS